MGFFYQALRHPEPEEDCGVREESLLGLRSEVEADGDAAIFDLHYTNHRPFKCRVPLLQAASIINEVRDASVKMLEKQQLKLDRGASKVLEICQAAIRPAVTQVMVDPMTHDRIFLFQFEHQAPISIRVSPEELPGMLASLARAMSRELN